MNQFLITTAPLVGLHITVSHFLFAEAKPFAIDKEIFLRFDDFLLR